MPSIEPQLWVEGASAAVAFYEAAFGAAILHLVGDGDDIVAQLSVGQARFWVTEANEDMGRHSPNSVNGTTGRTLLVVDDPAPILKQAVAVGATEMSPVSDEHGWRLARLVDPSGMSGRSVDHSAVGHPRLTRPNRTRPQSRRSGMVTTATVESDVRGPHHWRSADRGLRGGPGRCDVQSKESGPSVWWFPQLSLRQGHRALGEL